MPNDPSRAHAESPDPTADPSAKPRTAIGASPTPSAWTQPARPAGLGTPHSPNDVGATSGADPSQSFGLPDQKFPSQNFSPSIPQTFSGNTRGALDPATRQAALSSPRIQALLQGNGILAALLRGMV